MNEKQSKATPGPWFVVNDGTDDEPMMSVKAARIAGQKPRHVVAICATGDSPQEMENANARLIAAAPDMLEALRTAVQLVETDVICARPGDRETLIAALRDWNAAITKATQGA